MLYVLFQQSIVRQNYFLERERWINNTLRRRHADRLLLRHSLCIQFPDHFDMYTLMYSFTILLLVLIFFFNYANILLYIRKMEQITTTSK